MRLHLCVLISVFSVLEDFSYSEGVTLHTSGNSTNSTAIAVIPAHRGKEEENTELKNCFRIFQVSKNDADIEKFISTETDLKRLAVRILLKLCLLYKSITQTMSIYLGSNKTMCKGRYTNCSGPLTLVKDKMENIFREWEEDDRDTYPISRCEVSMQKSLLRMVRNPLKSFIAVISETSYVRMLSTFDRTVGTIFPELAKIFHYILDTDMETMKHFMARNVLPLRRENIHMVKKTMTVRWGIITSTYTVLHLKCHPNEDFNTTTLDCVTFHVERAVSQNLECSLLGSSAPLSWEGEEGYFDSSCLCLLTSSGSGSNCAVWPSEGVDVKSHCLVVLLEGFVKLVRRRVAVTYLDYTYKTKVSLKALEWYLLYKHAEMCDSLLSIKNSSLKERISHYKRIVCYFPAVVNKPIHDCGEVDELSLTPFDLNTSCLVLATLLTVMNGDFETDTQYSMMNHECVISTLSQILTSVDIFVRAFTLLAFVSFRQLRNLPGKIFIGYQTTALTNIFLVKGLFLTWQTLIPKSVTVAVDVYLDMSASFWLCSMSHFLFWCIRSLGPPDDLPRSTARVYLSMYAAFSWVVPAVLCAIFFHVDRVPYFGMEFGRLGLFVADLSVLFVSVIFFVLNFRVYRIIKKGVRPTRTGITTFSHYQDLFQFGVKTFIMSGAGIFVRIMLMQSTESNEVLNVFYILSTCHGALIFLVYGLNCKVRSLLQETIKRVLRTSKESPKNQYSPH